MLRQVVISSRFNGPPNSGNGGYSCGVVAEGIEGTAQVRLRVPPPLGREMLLAADGQQATMTEGDVVVGEAVAADLDLVVPDFPDMAEAQEAGSRYTGLVEHPFPTCFVCGPDWAEGDRLRIFAGPVDGRLHASPWIPHQSLVDETGLVGRRHVWTALDCPSFFSNEGAPPALLAQLTADIVRVPEAGEPLIAIAWPIEAEGRKRWAGSALATSDGELIGRARALWIEPSGGLPNLQTSGR